VFILLSSACQGGEKFKTPTHFLEKLEAITKHEMNIGRAICRAKEEELDMRIAASLTQKRITLDAQTKEVISQVYQNFSEIMRERLKKATNLFIEAERKFIQDCKFIQKLSDDLLKKIYVSLNN
jgi:hypothetical protein